MTFTPRTQTPQASRHARWRLPLWGTIVALLLTPLVAMQFTREVAWDAADFVFAGVLLIGGGVVFELAALKIHKSLWRIAIALGLLFVVALIWADAAVGVF